MFSKQLTNQDKTPAVISRAMAKHNLEVEPEEGYELVQVISEERGRSGLTLKQTLPFQFGVTQTISRQFRL